MRTEAVVRIGSQEFTGWKELELTRGIEAMSGQLSLKASDLETPYLLGNLRAGIPVDVHFDGKLMFDGFVDTVRDHFDGSGAGFEITARDRVADLIDCAATVDGPHEFAGQTLDQVIAAVIKPYGISLTVSADTGAAFGRLAINPGETAFEFIERICRYRAVLPVSDGVGGLLVIKPGQESTDAALIYGENILSWDASHDASDLFSLYVFKGQIEGGDWETAEEVSGQEGRATDDKVTRYRPFVETAESQGAAQTLAERAKWQKQINRARAMRLSVAVAGWETSEDGGFWMPNRLVHVTALRGDADHTFFITGVKFSRGLDGTKTQLEMTLPGAFDIVPEAEPETESSWG